MPLYNSQLTISRHIKQPAGLLSPSFSGSWSPANALAPLAAPAAHKLAIAVSTLNLESLCEYENIIKIAQRKPTNSRVFTDNSKSDKSASSNHRGFQFRIIDRTNGHVAKARRIIVTACIRLWCMSRSFWGSEKTNDKNGRLRNDLVDDSMLPERFCHARVLPHAWLPFNHTFGRTWDEVITRCEILWESSSTAGSKRLQNMLTNKQY